MRIKWEEDGTKGIPITSFLIGLAAVLFMLNGFMYLVDSGGLSVGGWVTALFGVLLLIIAKSYFGVSFWAWGLIVVISPLLTLLYAISLAVLDLVIWLSIFLTTLYQWSLFREGLHNPESTT